MTQHAPIDAGIRPGASAFTPGTASASQVSAAQDDHAVHRPNWLVATPLIALNVILTWLGRAPGMTTGHDDAEYFLLGRALRTGQGFVELFTRGHPAHAQYPPVYPGVIAALTSIFGERISVLLAFNIAFEAGALALFYGFMARRWRPGIALSVLALAAVNPTIVFLSGSLMSEALFTLLLLATLVLASTKQQSAWSLAAIGLLAVASAFTRTAGLTLVGAVCLVWLLERRWAAALSLAVVGGGLGAAWLYRAAHAVVVLPGRSYVADAVVGGDRTGVGLGRMVVSRVVTNGRSYLTELLPSVLPVPSIRGTLIDNVFFLVLLVVCGTMGLRLMWKQARAIAVFLGCYGALLLVWAWPLSRFLEPILPILLLTILIGAIETTRQLRGRRAIVLAGFTTLAIAFAAIQQDVEFLSNTMRCDRVNATTASSCFNADQRAFIESAREIARSAPGMAIVASEKPATMYYFSSGHEVVPLEVATQSNSQGFAPDLLARGVRDVVLDHVAAGGPRVADRLADNCAHLRIERAVSPTTIVFELQEHATPADSTASCAAVAAYRASETQTLEQIW